MPSVKQFDVREALSKALEAFWEHGYQGTSMTILLKYMGIQKGSFYATFESKRAVFIRALEQYVDERARDFSSLGGEESTAKELIEQMIQFIRKECRSKDGHRGCFVLNTALEIAEQDEDVARVVQRSIRAHETLIKGILDAGVEDGELSSDMDTTQTARAIMAQIFAMRVYSRAGMPLTTIDSFRDQTLALLD